MFLRFLRGQRDKISKAKDFHLVKNTSIERGLCETEDAGVLDGIVAGCVVVKVESYATCLCVRSCVMKSSLPRFPAHTCLR